MTTQYCAHGELLARWCDACAADFTVRTGEPLWTPPFTSASGGTSTVAWTIRPARRPRWPLVIVAAAIVAALLAWREIR